MKPQDRTTGRYDIIAFRVSKEMKAFAKSLKNPSEFMLNLVENSPEYKKYLREKKELDSAPKLF